MTCRTITNGNRAFRFTNDEALKYSSEAAGRTTGFGNACLLASKVLAANGGTRYIMITLGSWDHHTGIYDAANLPSKTRELDAGLSQLIADLKASGAYNETLIVVMGEFGRTTGKLTDTAGRDHWSQQFVMFAGAGVKGGRVLGSTDAEGKDTVESGWSHDRVVRAEDVETTIYSALGIDYSTIRYDDPFGRGFYYVPDPKAGEDPYAPIKELWS